MSEEEDDDDRLWLDTLAGRAPDGANAEAGRLRAQLLARTSADPPALPPRDAAREDALVARARREGLLPAPARRGGFWRGLRPVLAAAALGGAALLAGHLLRPEREAEVVRSGPGGIVRLRAEDPAARARALQAELRDAGVEAVAYERLGRHGVDADLPQPLPLAVRSVLQRHAIPEPPQGILQVEFEEAERP